MQEPVVDADAKTKGGSHPSVKLARRGVDGSDAGCWRWSEDVRFEIPLFTMVKTGCRIQRIRQMDER